MATSWFKYNKSGEVCNPLNFTEVPVKPLCPKPNQRLCAIFAKVQIIDGQRKPIITSALCTEIHTTLQTLQESANVLLQPD